MTLSKDLKSFPSFSDDKSIKSLATLPDQRLYGMQKNQRLGRCCICGLMHVTHISYNYKICQYCAREPIGD